MLTYKIGGVPEHFNIPWQMAIEDKRFEKLGVQLEWKDFGGGTGAMNAALRDKEIDLAIMLTEGILLDCHKGNPSTIIGQYVESPLIWGIHTSVKNNKASIADMHAQKFAISRLGSGSHIMPAIDVAKQGYKIEEAQLVIVRNLEGAIHALSNGDSDIFYWEKFITKPFVNRKILKCLGESPTPWPSFVLVARKEVAENELSKLQDILQIALQTAYEFKKEKSSIERICKSFLLKESEAIKWMNSTDWSKDGVLQSSTIQSVMDALRTAALIA